jgi:hypothetical protein
MKIFYQGLKPVSMAILVALLCLQSCKSDHGRENTDQIEADMDNSIEIVTEAMDFQTRDEIKSGWQTFRYVNNSTDTHFFLLEKYPEGKSIKDAETEVAPTFQKGMDLITEGKAEEGYAEFNKLPAWFFKIVFSGGSGLVSPGKKSMTTVKLDPGYYVMECYVKMPNGTFHSSMGMTTSLLVTPDSTQNVQPAPNVKITISSTGGIVYDDIINAGKQVFEVYFKDQIAHENFVGHDINLVKLNQGANLEILEKWINWVDPKGLISPAPEGFTFLGGVNDMPAGSTGYFTATLEPGNYAFISEVPNALSKKMLNTFEVPLEAR